MMLGLLVDVSSDSEKLHELNYKGSPKIMHDDFFILNNFYRLLFP